MRSVTATRYVTPMREGGSLPGLMEADDLGMYVVKFIGAGQGRKTLIAEIVCAALAREVGLPVPELVLIDVDPALAAGEPDQEVQDLLRASGGLNLGCDFLPGALDLDPGAFDIDPALAGRILWFDALVGNVDRSWRNPNMLFWHRELRLIDHGASLTFHHSWSGPESEERVSAGAGRAYDAGDHALLSCAPDVHAADAELAGRVHPESVAHATAEIPDEWLSDEPGFASADLVREAYQRRILARIAARDSWLGPLAEAVAAGPRPRDVGRRGNRPTWMPGGGGHGNR